jgi:hypothetical protein
MVLFLIIVDLIVPAFRRPVARQMVVTVDEYVTIRNNRPILITALMIMVEEVKSDNAKLTVRDDEYIKYLPDPLLQRFLGGIC